MPVLTKSKTKSPEIRTNDLILNCEGLSLNKQAQKAVDGYLDSCLSWEADWKSLLDSRSDLLDCAFDLRLGELMEQADDLKAKRDRLQDELHQLLEERFALLPQLTPAFEQYVKDSIQAYEDAVKAVGDEFEARGVGRKCENAYGVNPSALEIQFRHRCEDTDEVRRAKGALSEVKARFAGFSTQQKVIERSRIDTAARITRWPALTDLKQRRIATILEIL